MKIGLNGQRLLTEKPAGPELYTYNLYQSLAKIDKTNEYVIYFDKKPSEEYFRTLTFENPNFKFKVIKKFLSWTQVSLATNLLLNPVDIFFSPAHTLPGLTYIFSFGKFKSIVMVHGLEHKTNRSLENKPFHKAVLPFVLFWICTTSKSIIVPSNATKQALLNAKIPFLKKEKIAIVPEGVGDEFYKRDTSEIYQIKSKYNLRQNRYLFFVSTIQPRKNLPNMVKAFSELVKQKTELKDLQLVIAGKKGWQYEESIESPTKYGIPDKVKFIGRIPEADLPVLMSGATAYVSVSLEEGFGLPLLEAMACEAPSVVSNIPAYREIAEDIPLYVDPYNVESIREGMERVLQYPEDKSELRKRAQLFTWENTAKKTLEEFEKLK